MDDIIKAILLTKQMQCAEKSHEKYLEKIKNEGRTPYPWVKHPPNWLIARLKDEVKELEVEFNTGKYPSSIMSECKDIINFAWFIYEWALARQKKEHTP